MGCRLTRHDHMDSSPDLGSMDPDLSFHQHLETRLMQSQQLLATNALSCLGSGPIENLNSVYFNYSVLAAWKISLF
jgi:hypothetical protein